MCPAAVCPTCPSRGRASGFGRPRIPAAVIGSRRGQTQVAGEQVEQSLAVIGEARPERVALGRNRTFSAVVVKPDRTPTGAADVGDRDVDDGKYAAARHHASHPESGQADLGEGQPAVQRRILGERHDRRHDRRNEERSERQRLEAGELIPATWRHLGRPVPGPEMSRQFHNSPLDLA